MDDDVKTISSTKTFSMVQQQEVKPAVKYKHVLDLYPGNENGWPVKRSKCQCKELKSVSRAGKLKTTFIELNVANFNA